jgi:hypothetical protein
MTTSRQAPTRVQLSRRKGFKLPPNTVIVARPSKWGNPFVVGHDGNREYCVKLYQALLRGFICLGSKASPEEQQAALAHVRDHLHELRGKHLACWCPLGGDYWSCHANVLLDAARRGRVRRAS